MNLPSAPAAFTVPSLGDVEIHHRPARFLEWFAGLITTDGAEVFQAMLREHGRRPGEDALLDPAGIAALDTGALRAGAEAFLNAAGADLRPRWIRDPAQPGAVRERTAGEDEDLSPRSGEDELERLVRILKTASDDAKLGRRHHAARVSNSVSRAVRAGLTPGILAQARDLTTLGQVNKMIADLPGNQLKGLISQTRGLSALTPNPGLLSGIRSDLSPAYLRGGALESLRRQESLLRSMGLLGASQKGLLGLAQGGVYNQLLGGALRNLSVSSLLAPVPRPADWLKEINSVLGLGLTAQLLAAAATAHAAPAGDPAELATFMRPGWQATAAIGMARDDARPAARVVLTAYDADMEPQGELLTAAVAIAHQLDETDETLFARILAILEPMWSRIVSLSLGETDEVRRQAIFVIATLVITYAQLHVGNEALKVAQAGPTAAQLEALSSEATTVLREEQQKAREAQRDDAQRFRQVTERCVARAAPDRDAPAIVTIYPDQLIRLIDEEGEWVKVEVFQYDTDAIVTGWTPRAKVVHRGS